MRMRGMDLFFVNDVDKTVRLVQCVWYGESVEIDLFSVSTSFLRSGHRKEE